MPEPSPMPEAPARPDAGVRTDPEPTTVDPATPPPTPRSTTLSVAVLVTLILLTAMVFLRVPYAVSSPGPTRDTLGEVDGVPLIEVEDGTPTHESTGQLLLTTVSVIGGPGYPATLPEVVSGWLSASRTVRPVELVFPPDVTQDQLDEQNQAAMTSSQESATVAALEELGHDVPVDLVVADAVEGSGAHGVVEAGDVVVSLQGTAVESYAALVEALAQTPPDTTVSVGVLRDGEPLGLEIVTGERPDGGSQLGLFIDPDFDLPVDVTIQIEDIGGPSAGLMFALGIVDRLTPEDELAGEVVAGTGTMDVTGEVGPIGGIAQKMAGAERDGAEWFLAPADNCADVVGHVPAGLRVVPVATLAEGRDAIEAIGAGDAESLPTCTAAS